MINVSRGAGLYARAGPAFDPYCCIVLPNAQIAVMGPEAAVQAVYANKIAELQNESEIHLYKTSYGEVLTTMYHENKWGGPYSTETKRTLIPLFMLKPLILKMFRPPFRYFVIYILK